MGKVTFVVEFEDGKEPAVHSGMAVLDGKLIGVAWKDTTEEQLVSVADRLPAPNDTVLLYDANGEGWIIGWRSVWYGPGQKETGQWEWTYQIDDLDAEEMNITHWAPMPDEPNME